MTAAERRALLGGHVISRIREEAAAAPAPTQDLVGELRRILTHPAHRPAQGARPAA